MRFSSTETIRLSGVGAVLAPLLLVGVAQVLHIGGATGAALADASGGALVGQRSSTTLTLTKEQRAAIAFSRSTNIGVELPSPFFVPTSGEPEPIAPAPKNVEPGVDSEPADAGPPPTVRISSIVSGGPYELAMIDGRPRRVGDEVAPGWSLHAIHAAQRAVTLRHRDGRTIRVAIELR